MGRFIFVRGHPYAGEAACGTCHGPNGGGTEALPRLAGQHAQYTENPLKTFSKRERTNDNAVLHGTASKLNELDLTAVAAYINGLNRRRPAAPSRRAPHNAKVSAQMLSAQPRA